MAPIRTGGGDWPAAVTASLQAAAMAASGTTSASVTAARAKLEVFPRVLSRLMVDTMVEQRPVPFIPPHLRLSTRLRSVRAGAGKPH